MYTMPSTIATTDAHVLRAANLEDYVSRVEEDDLAHWKTKRVRPLDVPLVTADETVGAITSDLHETDPALWLNTSGVIPLAVIPGLPAKQYPLYMTFLLRATLASFSLSHCSLASSMLHGFGLTLAAVVVAARCGIWASTSVVPRVNVASPAVADCVLYDPDKDIVVRDSAHRHRAYKGWYWLLSRIDTPSRLLEELMIRIAHVSPVLLDMACGEMSRHGTSYAQPYVERAVSSYLKSKLSPDAYAIANLNHRLVWSALREAVMCGMPVHLLDRWARDPAFHVQAHRRLLSSSKEIEQSRLDEHAARTRSRELTVVPDEATDVDADHELTSALRAAAPMTPEDDLVTEDGLSEWGGAADEFLDPDGVDLPVDVTAIPSREHTPPPPVTEVDRQAIMDAIRDASAQGPRAESELRDARDDLTVQW